MVDQAIVLASRPVALSAVGNRPLAVHALEALAGASVKRVCVLIDEKGYDAIHDGHSESVPDGLTLRWTEVEQGACLRPSMVAASDFANDEPFVLHLADSVARGGLRRLLGPSPGELDTTVLRQRRAPGGDVVDLAHHRLPAVAPDSGGPTAGVWLVGRGFAEAAAATEPATRLELEINAAARRMAERGGHVRSNSVDEWWRYHERPGILLEGNRFALENLCGLPVEAHTRDTVIQGPVAIHPSAQLESTTVRGPAVIGAGACIRDAYIGPYTSVGRNVVIEGAEVEHSIVLAGASIKHLSGRLEASVVGANARIFRDFRLPRAMRLNVGEGAEVSLT